MARTFRNFKFSGSSNSLMGGIPFFALLSCNSSCDKGGSDQSSGGQSNDAATCQHRVSSRLLADGIYQATFIFGFNPF